MIIDERTVLLLGVLAFGGRFLTAVSRILTDLTDYYTQRQNERKFAKQIEEMTRRAIDEPTGRAR